MSKLLALALILGAAPAKKAATSMVSPVKEDPWEFDRLTAKVRVKGVPADELTTLAARARNQNAWFDVPSVTAAVAGIAYLLAEAPLRHWAARYPADDYRAPNRGGDGR